MSPFRQLSELEQAKRQLLQRSAQEREDCRVLARRLRTPLERADRVLAFVRGMPLTAKLAAGIGGVWLWRRAVRSPRLSFVTPLLWRVIRSSLWR